jgi:type II secretion system protein C
MVIYAVVDYNAQIIGVFMNKLLVVLIVLVALVAAYAVFSINEEPLAGTGSKFTEIQNQQASKQSIDQEIKNVNQQQENVVEEEPKALHVNADLPAKFVLRGIVYSQSVAESFTALLVDQTAGEYFVDENINNLDVYVKRINKGSVILEFESRDYELLLGETNSLIEEQTQQRFNEMTAKEIGSRPRQLEHIVKTLPNLFNDGGKVIIPGMNPDLYSKVRFQEGDVLLEVNGFEIDDDKQLSDLQKEIRSAQTLSFKVNRAGRFITLYLDIPHEALKL